MTTATLPCISSDQRRSHWLSRVRIALYRLVRFRRSTPEPLIPPDQVFTRLVKILKPADGIAMAGIQAKRISELYAADYERCRDVSAMIRADEAEALANRRG